MKFPLRCSGSLMVAVGAAFFAPPTHCGAESGAFDPRSALHFDAPVVVGTYAFDVERVFGTQTQMIRRKATKRQREVAEANAHAYMAAQLRALGVAPSSKSGKPDDATAKTKKRTEPQSMQEARAKLPHYVAVDTVKDARSVPGTKKDMMIWDTRSESLVDNNVYDVSNPPPVGSTEKFDTYSTIYVGGKLSLPEIAEPPPEPKRQNAPAR